MISIFRDPLHERLGAWPLAYIPYGGADFGEIVVIADAVGDGDDDAFHAAWARSADRLVDQADNAAAAGNHVSARESLLRAACFYGKSYHPLFGLPRDTRLTVAYRHQIDALSVRSLCATNRCFHSRFHSAHRPCPLIFFLRKVVPPKHGHC